MVLRHIATKQGISRIEIAKAMHLTKMAITNIVDDLIKNGYVVEKECIYSNLVGRRPMSLYIAPNAGKVMSVYLSRNELTALLSDLSGNILCKCSSVLENETSDTLSDKLFSTIDKVFDYAKTHHSNSPILGIGVACIGPIDTENGEILNPPDFFEITRFPVVSMLEQRYELSVYMNNDMNASSLAENLFGVGRKHENFIYVGLTRGIGMGIVSNSELYQQGSGFAGEIGHITIDYRGERCSCGNRGCLETYANIPVILKRLSEASGEADVSVHDLQRLSVHPACRRVLEDVTDKLAIALTNTINLLDPQCVVIGAEGAYLPDFCLEMLEREINSHILAVGYRQVQVVRATFGSDTPLVGSASCVLERIFNGHVPVCNSQSE